MVGVEEMEAEDERRQTKEVLFLLILLLLAFFRNKQECHVLIMALGARNVNALISCLCVCVGVRVCIERQSKRESVSPSRKPHCLPTLFV